MVERIGTRPTLPPWRPGVYDQPAYRDAMAKLREWEDRKARIERAEAESIDTCPLVDPRAHHARREASAGRRRPRVCGLCGNDLPGRRTAWCSDECAVGPGGYYSLHRWSFASMWAVVRGGGRCQRCGDRAGARRTCTDRKALEAWSARQSGRHWNAGDPMPQPLTNQCWVVDCPNVHAFSPGGLQVDHIQPREGRGYGDGCFNHPDNLQPLCVPCHAIAGVVRRRVREAFEAAARPALPSGPRVPQPIILSLWAAA